MTKQEVITRYWKSAKAVADGLHLGIGPDCEGDIRNFIRMGADALEQEDALNDPTRIDLAEIHLCAFVGGMAFEARRLNLPMLREVTFHAARTQFCPVWPFC